jgi:hypothetical protein
MIWFSRVYGDLGDNLDIVAAQEGAVPPDWLESYSEPGSVTRFVGDLFPVNEYLLNGAIARWVGLVSDNESTSVTAPDLEYELHHKQPNALPAGVLQLLSCHDECFCNITPLTDVAVRRIVTQVLKLHNFYRGRTYDWSQVIDEIISLLTRHRALRLSSHLAGRFHGAMTDIGIPREGWSIDQWREQKKGPRFKLAGQITFDNEVARLQLPKTAR